MLLDHKKTVIRRLNQAARASRARAGAYLAEFGLHAGQETILQALAERDGMSMSELAAELGVQPPTVTKMVSRLSAEGYLKRRVSDGDARQAHVFLTSDGKAVVASIDKILKRVEKEALADIGRKDRRRLRRLLKRVEKNLADSDAIDLVPKSSRRTPRTAK